jgi:hypothetical protein
MEKKNRNAHFWVVFVSIKKFLQNVKADGRKFQMSLGQFFNFNIDCFDGKPEECDIHGRPHLTLKTRTMFCINETNISKHRGGIGLKTKQIDYLIIAPKAPKKFFDSLQWPSILRRFRMKKKKIGNAHFLGSSINR